MYHSSTACLFCQLPISSSSCQYDLYPLPPHECSWTPVGKLGLSKQKHSVTMTEIWKSCFSFANESNGTPTSAASGRSVKGSTPAPCVLTRRVEAPVLGILIRALCLSASHASHYHLQIVTSRRRRRKSNCRDEFRADGSERDAPVFTVFDSARYNICVWCVTTL